ncbi:ATP-dependent Clp protease adapter ClpS [Tsukamurella sp. 8F]|uniref:ATP-dependent Clp protease adapter ClpS n=1 Tax=unclassified Tsukamurella TaxID=2633480 RepID=UPI0023B9C12B|nr:MULTISPECIES: ATP-dependent Clp protease adapter ClpS [unclassified Tsukamurella]MDF0531002.1 ATP-dependent Clp protease adapter ClpS [Tsukamurella sp. 8J]MDF0588703.1 ATP-dependent Clp protease adapter ClpS [Tsukamurella sp. 8F]
MSNHGEAVPGVGPSSAALLERQEEQSVDKPWLTVVWDDPVNLMSYVTFVFRKLFGFSTAKAKELMMQVHTEGRAVVSTGDRDKVEGDVRKLHAAGLWATMQRDS